MAAARGEATSRRRAPAVLIDRIRRYRRGSPGELCLGELGEQPALGDELVERAGLHHPPLIEDQHARRVPDGREAMGDDEGGARRHHLVERQLQLLLGRGVERARRFVQDQDRRVLQQRAGDREALALTARERAAALADDRVETLRLTGDELRGLGAPDRLLQLLFVASGRPARRFSRIERANSMGS